MITIDNRVGSKDLYPLLPPAKAKLGRLPFADAAFLGNGPNNIPVLVGVELKRIGDAINSMETGRFAGHQLPGLLASYNVVYLVVEGIWREGEGGLLEVRKGRMWHPMAHGRRQYMVRELENWLTTQEILGGVKIRTTTSPKSTAQLLLHLHNWWTSKDYNDHRSHMALDNSNDLTHGLLTKPDLKWRLAKELPGVGWQRGKDMAESFDTPLEMLNASVDRLVEVGGVGKGTAGKVYKALRKGK